MRWSRPLLAAVFSVCCAAVSYADDARPQPGWTEAVRSPEIVIFYQDNERAHARAFQAIGEVDAPPDAVFRVVTNVEDHPRFMPFTKESTIVQRTSPNDVVVYQVVSPPLVSDRDAYFHITTTPGASPTSVWRSAWIAVPDFGPERSGRVRMRIAEGTWLFEPLDGGTRTRLTYNALTNIGGSVPGWMTNSSSLSVMKKMYAAIRKRVAEVAPRNHAAP